MEITLPSTPCAERMLAPGLAPRVRAGLQGSIARSQTIALRPPPRLILRHYVSSASQPSASASAPPKWYQRPLTLLLAFVPVFTFGLGVWQIKRLRWKLDLIDELEDKLKREPLELPRNVE